MRRRKKGKRYPLLLYQRVMDRLWGATFVLGSMLIAIWGWSWFTGIQLLASQNNVWLFIAGIVLLSFTLFAFFGRKVAYVQAYKDHIRLVTPFLRTNISYRRIRRFYPADFQQLYPPHEASWARRQLLFPLYGKTAVVVELNSYPLHPILLRFFLAPQMFSPKTTGLVFLVPDWMKFSMELDSFRGGWLDSRGRRRAAPGSLHYGLDG